MPSPDKSCRQRIWISQIITWNRKSYLTHVILSRVSRVHYSLVVVELTQMVVKLRHCHVISPYLTGLRLFCDNWRQTSRVGGKAVSKQSPVIRNLLACVAKWRKVVAKISNMFKNFMRQNSSQNSRKVIAGVSNPSRTCRRPLAI